MYASISAGLWLADKILDINYLIANIPAYFLRKMKYIILKRADNSDTDKVVQSRQSILRSDFPGLAN